MAGGFLLKHGLKHTYAVLAPGETAAGMIREGKTDVMQSAPSTNWAKMEKGETGFPLHFALINRRDGFFLVSRLKEHAFEWAKIEGKAVIADHGSQPLTMLRYAVDHNGADGQKINFINAGGPDQMMSAFRAGQGDYIHLQAPLPQLLEEEGVGWTAVSVGASMPPNAFSSLCASKDFIATDECGAFAKAFAEAKEWVRTAPAAEIAAAEAPYFPGISQSALASAIASYQNMGAWDGGSGIPHDLYEQSLNVFEHSGAIRQRQPYDAVCVQFQG